MAQKAKSLFHRIHTVKSSLENAEQSFKDNQEIRGELDLMLAEAELKNLRRKKDVPWNWNRQLFAGCAAVLLVLAGLGGWYFARGHYKQRQVPVRAAQTTAVQSVKQAQAAPAQAQAGVSQVPNKEANIIEAASAEETQPRVNISKSDMRRLVQSARTELSNSK